MKLDRIYTRSGDDGRTSLGDGARLPKFHVRVAAYGSVDEANSVIGIAMLHVSDADIRDVLTRVQNDLFDLGSDLCRPEREHRKVEPLRVSERQVIWIEERIDAFNAALSPLDSFVLPGGTQGAAYLHHARTVIRRAERYMTEIAYQEPLNPAALKYANRLSDLPFVMPTNAGGPTYSGDPDYTARRHICRASAPFGRPNGCFKRRILSLRYPHIDLDHQAPRRSGGTAGRS
jgi:cob(I)alamin adenosyltransferase